MSEMPVIEEIGMRARTLHRRKWLNSLGTNTGFVHPNADVVIGDLKISQAAGAWIVTLLDTVVYYEHSQDGTSVEEGHVKKALQILRTAMILEDLADV
jgi:hypothetical protein